jgi:hypothetical protein
VGDQLPTVEDFLRRIIRSLSARKKLFAKSRIYPVAELAPIKNLDESNGGRGGDVRERVTDEIKNAGGRKN